MMAMSKTCLFAVTIVLAFLVPTLVGVQFVGKAMANPYSVVEDASPTAPAASFGIAILSPENCTT